MQSVNLGVIESVCHWLKRGESIWYITIMETWGTSPRPVGSIFAYNPVVDEVAGSLSGGCIEQDLIDELSALGSAPNVFRKQYGINEDERNKFQLPCGGRMELVIEYLPAESKYLDHFTEIKKHLLKRQRVTRYCDFESGVVSIKGISDRPLLTVNERGMWHRLGPEYRLLIIGAGDITRYLVSMAAAAEFSVSVCDPRESFMRRSGLSTQEIELVKCLPDDLVKERFNDPYCAVVALAHDPRVDDLALLAALDSKAYFVGALGSQKTCRNRVKRLRSLGVTESQLVNLHAPVGLSVGSKTPPEIAVSIIAQLIEKRHLHQV